MSRLLTIRKRLLSENLDAIIVTNLKNIYYLSGFWGTAATVLVTQKAQYLLTDARYSSEARDAAADFKIIETTDTTEQLNQLLKQEAIRQVGFEDSLSYAAVKQFQAMLTETELRPLTDFVEIQRQIKSESEIKTIKKACQISDQAFQDLLKFVEPGKTEIEVANFLDFKMRALGASGTSFETIVASGHGSALPHGRATHKPIDFGDVVTVDFGCYYQHYASDMTRTFFVGDASPKLEEMYRVVQAAQEAVIEKSIAGLTYGEYDRTAREIIDKAGYREAFTHGIGHGLGLDVHELPYFSKTSSSPLLENMVITDEPGLYLTGVGGIRIEDDLLITKEGVEVLTLAPKELIVL